MKFITITIITLIALVGVQAQNHHFSQFNQSSISLKATDTGNFAGDYRLGGQYRNQWAGINNPFKTISVFTEMKKNRFGYGLMLLNNGAGVASVKTTNVLFSMAYHQPISEKGAQLSIGGQFGLMQRGFDPSKMSFEDQFLASGNANQLNGTTEFFTRTSRTQPILNIGLQFQSPIKEKAKMGLGFQLNNINRPNISFSDERVAKPIILNLNAMMAYQLTEKIELEGQAMFWQAAKDKNAALLALLNYDFNEDFKLIAGAGYRVKEAMILKGGIEFMGYQVGASYDITMSKLANVSKTGGAFELYFSATFGKKTSKYSDRDKDGIEDALDRCPDVAGIAKFFGCPDSDFDGIVDDKDECPFEFGLAKNNGCPEIEVLKEKIAEPIIKEEPVVETLTIQPNDEFKAIVEFDTDKHIIKEQFFPVLDKLIYYLKFKENVLIRLDGHTDTEGNDQYNYILGMQRAQAVRDYLIAKGVSMEDIIINSYGKFKPKADNVSTVGKQRNRRVEIELIEVK